VYTLKELALYDGKQESGEILVALDGVVYDVSEAKTFYGPGGTYEIFGGRDATRALAKHLLEKEKVPDPNGPLDDLSDLTEEDKKRLQGWKQRFDKYKVVGKLTE